MAQDVLQSLVDHASPALAFDDERHPLKHERVLRHMLRARDLVERGVPVVRESQGHGHTAIVGRYHFGINRFLVPEPLRRGVADCAAMGFLIRIVVNAFAIWIVTLIPALMVSVIPFPPGETLQLVLTLLLVALIFALVNTIIGTVIKVLAFPLYILTLGLIGLLINGFLLWFTAWITGFWDWGLRVEDFWWGLVAAIIISLINWLAGLILRPKKD